MDKQRAIHEMPIYAGAIQILDEEPGMPEFAQPSRRMRREHRKDRFLRDHGIGLIVMFLWGITIIAAVIITSVIVRNNAMQDLETAKAEAVDEYIAKKAKETQAEYFKSGEASREAAKNQDVDMLARWMSFFQTDQAKMSFGGNVLVRCLSTVYPDDIRSVLTEPKQFDFGNESLVASARDQELAGIIWEKINQRILPAGLTMDHLYGEVRDGGKDYVVRNTYEITPRTDFRRAEELKEGTWVFH